MKQPFDLASAICGRAGRPQAPIGTLANGLLIGPIKDLDKIGGGSHPGADTQPNRQNRRYARLKCISSPPPSAACAGTLQHYRP